MHGYHKDDTTTSYHASKYKSSYKDSAEKCAKCTRTRSSNASDLYKKSDKLRRVYFLFMLLISVSGLISAVSDEVTVK